MNSDKSMLAETGDLTLGLIQVESGPLSYLIALPEDDGQAGPRPLLCFLHGYGEGAPMPIRQALTLHGPLATGASIAAAGFIVVAPQLPVRGDFWYKHAAKVREIVRRVQMQHNGDPDRTFLTGFSFGGNGVLDLALVQPEFWTALWPVDPTRVPATDPQCPIWLSSGEISRRYALAFMQRLGLKPLQPDASQDRVYEDQNQDHVATARFAYRNDDAYRWLLSRQKQ
ncbi:MAG TPA: hypothetical protein VF268_05590 [Gammaproteobacteria bacterium]